MASVKVVLTKIIDDSGYPTFGAFEFTELSGEVVVIHEKFPVVGVEEADSEIVFPMDVDLACTIISASQTDVLIDISRPYGIEDVQGRTEFRVNPDLVIR